MGPDYFGLDVHHRSAQIVHRPGDWRLGLRWGWENHRFHLWLHLIPTLPVHVTF